MSKLNWMKLHKTLAPKITATLILATGFAPNAFAIDPRPEDPTNPPPLDQPIILNPTEYPPLDIEIIIDPTYFALASCGPIQDWVGSQEDYDACLDINLLTLVESLESFR